MESLLIRFAPKKLGHAISRDTHHLHQNKKMNGRWCYAI